MSTLSGRVTALAGQLWREGNLVLVAEPGAGKTTLLPPALAAHPNAPPGQIWVLQPRRLAAQMAARRVADTLGCRVGETVGYRVRFDDATGPATRIVFMTDGIFGRLLAHDPGLARTACVLFDEFHERTLAQDAQLTALLALRAAGRTQVAVGVMSATLDHAAVCQALQVAEPVFVTGRTYPVAVQHVPHRPTEPMPQAVARALGQVLAAPMDADDAARGNVLVFLPGVRAIGAAQQAAAAVLRRHDVRGVPLHASLDARAQADAFATNAGRQVIFATNVAETSLTLPQVRCVVDTGRAKQAHQLPLTGVTQLTERDISQASAVQRAGRAGRVAAGRCLRLYTQADFRRRPAFDLPEVARLDLAPTLLWLAHLGLLPQEELPWIDPLPQAAAAAAAATLQRLGALRPDGTLTDVGRAMAALPVHPRLARMVVAGHALGVGRAACVAACALSETLPHAPAPQVEAARHSDSDLPGRCRQVQQLPQLRRVADGLARAAQAALGPFAEPSQRAAGDGRRAGAGAGAGAAALEKADADTALTQAVLAGFGDRVAKRLPPLTPRPEPLPLALAHGGKAVLAPCSEVRAAPFVVALAAEVAAHAPGAPLRVTCAHGVDAEALLGAANAPLAEDTRHAYDPARGRVMVHATLTYDGLAVLEDVQVERNLATAWPTLAQAFWRGPGQQGGFVAALAAVEARLTVAGQLAGAAPPWGASAPQALLRDAVGAALQQQLALGTALTKVDLEALVPAALGALPAAAQEALRRWVPEHVTLAHGKRLKVHYGADAPPYVESYLQDFFGTAATPQLADGRLPLTVHLWGPNRRPLQVTRDLANFWAVHYPSLRGALARRYPRHAWPDDPRHAQPPPPRAPRPRPRR